MVAGRRSFTLTLLADGGALAAGGSAAAVSTDRFSPGTSPFPPSLASWPTAAAAGSEIAVAVTSPAVGQGNDGNAGASNLDHHAFVVVRADGDGAGRAPTSRRDGSQVRLVVPSVGAGVAWLFPGYAGALGAGVPVLVDPPPGGACTLDAQCASGSCVDGVCCDGPCGGGAPDCQACSIAAGAAVDGTCAPLAAGTTCRAAAGPCDVPESCSGASATCPGDAFRPAGHACRAAASSCDAAEACTGGSATCPGDAPLPDGAACDDGGTCEAAVCVPAPTPPRTPRGAGCGTAGEGLDGVVLAALALLVRRRCAAVT
jgi:hypothetical protein